MSGQESAVDAIVFAWTILTGVGVIALAAIGWAIYGKLVHLLDVMADAANSLRKVVGDLNQARMSDELWAAVDGAARRREV